MDDDLTITTLAERPGLRDPLWRMPNTWPEFMRNEPLGTADDERIVAELPEYVLVVTDSRGEVVARALSVPFALDVDGRRELPPTGWDHVLVWAFSDALGGRKADTMSAVETAVAPGVQRRGLSGRLVRALREQARVRGFKELVAPLRPSAKHLEPDTPMSEYAFRSREADGLPHDPWIRVHIRAGAVIGAVAPASRTVSGSLDQWRAWTGLPFDSDGPVTVPGALVPVHCSVTHGHAVYTEPNVWVRHRL
ncbi:N-acetyltransferase [Streptomyces sp. GC420]|uniref:N-acetyltransferase n=1 Tax=Streptomyces sp. GC420 TaxID=2697568 RepID=UPI0014151D9A|nr:N-acetyltransferase [Streptomyces sp. GC420]NBM17902.1 N-acetyltransferase [Streptomyces sp. GC420]